MDWPHSVARQSWARGWNCGRSGRRPVRVRQEVAPQSLFQSDWSRGPLSRKFKEFQLIASEFRTASREWSTPDSVTLGSGLGPAKMIALWLDLARYMASSAAMTS